MASAANLIYDELIKAYKDIRKRTEGERLYIYCHPSQHTKLLRELNRLLDSMPFPALASLIPVYEVPVGQVYVTKRKYADYEYGELPGHI
jgi:hypothetical protein